jgi:hypothetical protein
MLLYRHYVFLSILCNIFAYRAKVSKAYRSFNLHIFFISSSFKNFSESDISVSGVGSIHHVTWERVLSFSALLSFGVIWLFLTALEHPPYPRTGHRKDWKATKKCSERTKIRECCGSRCKSDKGTESIEKWFPGMLPKALQTLAKVFRPLRELISRKFYVNRCKIAYFGVINLFRELLVWT